jgi:hypothetical protein
LVERRKAYSCPSFTELFKHETRVSGAREGKKEGESRCMISTMVFLLLLTSRKNADTIAFTLYNQSQNIPQRKYLTLNLSKWRFSSHLLRVVGFFNPRMLLRFVPAHLPCRRDTCRLLLL